MYTPLAFKAPPYLTSDSLLKFMTCCSLAITFLWMCLLIKPPHYFAFTFLSKWSISPAGLWNLFEGKSQAWSNLHFWTDSVNRTICTKQNQGWWKTLWVAGLSVWFVLLLPSFINPLFSTTKREILQCSMQRPLTSGSINIRSNITKCYCTRWRSRNIECFIIWL